MISETQSTELQSSDQRGKALHGEIIDDLLNTRSYPETIGGRIFNVVLLMVLFVGGLVAAGAAFYSLISLFF